MKNITAHVIRLIARSLIFTLVSYLTIWSSGATADTKESSTNWSTQHAVRAAQMAVKEGHPYLYSSGGFVCSPKYQPKYRVIAFDLPVKSLACGCVLTGVSLRQASYARHFNNQILTLLTERNTRS